MARKPGRQRPSTGGGGPAGFRPHGARPEHDRPPVQRRPRALGEVLGGLFDGELGRQLSGARALELWPEVVGEAIARVTRAEDFSGGVLSVRVLHPVWRVELQPMETMIVERLNERLEGRPVRRLRFV
jgi:predicted nucleic acid-binding Zn ribbon protein